MLTKSAKNGTIFMLTGTFACLIEYRNAYLVERRKFYKFISNYCFF